MYKLSVLFILAVAFIGCQSQKKQAELLELSKPEWLKERPLSSTYFYGIGIIPKTGSPIYYEEKARERALADLAKQINTRIKTETNFIKTENNKGVQEYIQSRIDATSSEFLEGYEYVDKWEDTQYFYAFYKLSKEAFFTKKRERKEAALQLALLKYKQGSEKQATHHWLQAMESYAAGIDALSGYLYEKNTMEDQGNEIDPLEENTVALTKLVNKISIESPTPYLKKSEGSTIKEGEISFAVSTKKGDALADIPVKLSYSGGYLTNELIASNENGICEVPSFKVTSDNEASLKASIDVVRIGRQITKNLYVRQLISDIKADSYIVIINPVSSGDE